jgi:DNA-binding LytR/AlgR family response regulator
MLESLRSYLTTPLTVGLSAGEHVRLVALVFLLTVASVAVIHLFLPESEVPGLSPLWALVVHAVTVGLTYTAWFLLMSVLLGRLLRRGWLRQVVVWQVWLASLACYVLGYFVTFFDDALTVALHQDVASARPLFHFLRLLPVWTLLTYLLIQGALHAGLRDDLARLAEVEAAPVVQPDRSGAPESRICIEAGRTRIDLPAESVTHVTVDDHYTYLYYRDQDGVRRTDVGLPLREVMTYLPEEFEQIHRSHAVNLRWVAGADRRGRNYSVRLRDGTTELPISRHRLAAVLPRLKSERGREDSVIP